jgi:hypothetical protein
VVVRGCPLGTDEDRCEWHACGTASEDDPRTPWRRWLCLDRRVRPVLGDHRLVGKSPEDSRQCTPGPNLPSSVLAGAFLASTRPSSWAGRRSIDPLCTCLSRALRPVL